MVEGQRGHDEVGSWERSADTVVRVGGMMPVPWLRVHETMGLKFLMLDAG